MHQEQLHFLYTTKGKFPESFKDCKVLEVGSCNVNGSIRYLFENCVYVGLDVGEGPCVDIVCSGHEYDAPDNSFDTVISSECFEHNPHWVETFKNMHRICRVDGRIILTCATTGRPEHGTHASNPQDSQLTIGVGWGNYYKNLTAMDFYENIDMNSLFSSHEFFVNTDSHDLYFYGVKK
jgi:SAM-dependent methyltransferase